MSTDRYVVIDEEGYFGFDGKKVDDQALGRTMIENLKMDDKGRLVTSLTDNPAFVEYFDAPLLAQHIRADGKEHGLLDLAYGASARFAFSTLSLDEWDRFHGVTENKIPFVLSRHAQTEFFEMLDGFDDESVTIGGKKFDMPPWLVPNETGEAPSYLGKLTEGEVSNILPVIIPQLKLVKSRILALGEGATKDAAYLASLGHLVTAVFSSEESMKRARDKHGNIETLNFIRADIFNLPEKWNEEFDMVYEHNCYATISPENRGRLVSIWKRVLQPNGHLLGIFNATEKRSGPPFGGSEWELRHRLKPAAFQFMYWTRWRQSVEERKGQELIVYARKTYLD